MKQCSKCKEWKPLDLFGKDKSGKDGFRANCKKCAVKRTHKYQQTHKIERSIYFKDRRKTLIGGLHHRFDNMKKRCDNPKCDKYKNYGGRGIKCLFKSADDFIDYVVNVLQVDPRGLTIDRIDNNGHYERGNIRFVTHKVNCNNR